MVMLLGRKDLRNWEEEETNIVMHIVDNKIRLFRAWELIS